METLGIIPIRLQYFIDLFRALNYVLHGNRSQESNKFFCILNALEVT